MHYSIQTTLAELEAACVEYYDEDTFTWKKSWQVIGGDKYIGQYASGQAVIAGPLIIGNPNKAWFEIQCTDPAILDDIAPNEQSTLKAKVRTDALIRAAYRVSGRGLIRNGAGNPVGPMPAFVIAGTDPKGSYLDGEDVEDADELLDLE